MTLKILFKFPSRERPKIFHERFREFSLFIKNNRDSLFLISLDEDDPYLEEYLEVLNPKKKAWRKMNIDIKIGKSKSKIHAINRDINNIVNFDWDILSIICDDTVPKFYGFDEEIRKDMKKYFPDTDGLLFYSDGIKGGKYNTHPVMGRKYYNRFGYLCNPDYSSLVADLEITAVGNMLNKQERTGRCVIQNLNPEKGKQKGEWIDNLYKRSRKGFSRSDGRTRAKRSEFKYSLVKEDDSKVFVLPREKNISNLDFYGECSNMNILFKCPSRERINYLENTLNSFYGNLQNKENFHFLISIDKEDPQINLYEKTLKKYNNLTYVVRKGRSKIDSLNRDINNIDYKWDILVIICDDTFCDFYGFDNIIRQDFEKYFPDLDGVIYHDGNSNKYDYEVAFHPSIGRKYYERFNYVFYPEYQSFCADLDFTSVAQGLNKYKRINDKTFVNHFKIKGDPVYSKWKHVKNHDLQILENRKKINFGL